MPEDPTLLGLPPLGVVAVSVVVACAAIVQGTVGIGFGIVLVPALALLAPTALPATPLLLAVALTALTARRERSAIDRDGFPALLAGRLVGTVIAVVVLLAVTEALLEVLFGTVILGVVALNVARPRVPVTRTTRLLAGTGSGLFATTAAIGGPPVALLYQHRPGPEVRSTLAALFFIGTLLSLAGLSVAGRLQLDHALLALVLLPALLAGFAVSRPLRRWLDGGWLRLAVLAFAAIGGVLAIARGLGG
ncbi:TSUP family transporter [Egibacter rhizosphaerae]|uniref:TSUP family transporter n=1 Tax=Egibacter rhizosphaerae TaxID=1670831 RepID=UPI0013F16EFB|nr:TSUP family transporter [Egibacter rhizosphaerae]